ncbi:MAG: dephospho-CoA kinase [Desulfitobacterium sp.]|nr:dephospho-CoA kinase [Desulfitobacterium sp.]
MFVIGLTGGIGSGKSTVSRWLAQKGIPIIDADKTVHELYKDPSTIEVIVDAFGEGILSDGQINRKALGQIVFAHNEERVRLERIIHPRVQKSMQAQQIAWEEKGEKICVWDVPLLFESHMDHLVDEIWVVWVPRDIQIERIKKRDSLSLEEIKLRIRAQESLDGKREKAHVVIDNSGKWEKTEEQLRKELERISRRVE